MLLVTDTPPRVSFEPSLPLSRCPSNMSVAVLGLLLLLILLLLPPLLRLLCHRRLSIRQALRIAEVDESVAADPLGGDMDLWARILSYLGDAELGSASSVCHTWYNGNTQSENSAERWKQVASRMLVDDFGEDMLPDLLALPEREKNLHGVANPWYSITRRLASCEYWGVPENENGEPCTHLVIDISGDVTIVGAALADARPLKIEDNVAVTDLNFVEAMEVGSG